MQVSCKRVCDKKQLEVTTRSGLYQGYTDKLYMCAEVRDARDMEHVAHAFVTWM